MLPDMIGQFSPEMKQTVICEKKDGLYVLLYYSIDNKISSMAVLMRIHSMISPF